MKPITVLFEFDTQDHGDNGSYFGFFKARFKNGYFKRLWFLCFAVAWVRMDLKEYNEYVGSGATEWRNK